LKNNILFTGKSFQFMVLALPLLMWLGYKEAQDKYAQPQAVVVLGGSTKRLEREKFTADFVRQHPNLPIWISGGSPPRYTQKVFAKAGIDPKRLHLDYEAVDTVTNFTTLVDDLQARGVKSVYLITSDFHMRRACVIGEIVLGSRGIEFKPVSVPSETSPEPMEKTIRDGARALVWVATGYTGVDDKNRR
jgi:uncharacterized SAM-binding protein YcdF (DUF218 family)